RRPSRSLPWRDACNRTTNANDPVELNARGPLNCNSPYSSVTAYVTLVFVQPSSLTTPKTCTGTIFPLGGHKVRGFVEIVMMGDDAQNDAAFSNTPTEPGQPALPHANKLDTMASGLPSPFTSPDVMEVASSPPVKKS